MGELRTMAHNQGDVRISWDPKKAFEVQLARDAFEKAKKEKYKAFRVVKKDAPGEEITEFDPEAKEILLVGSYQGG